MENKQRRRSKDSKRTRKLTFICLSVVLVLVMIGAFIYGIPKAAAGNPPAHSKTRTDNGDGTYKIELAVTGDADDEFENDTHINVLIIYDESSSMVSNTDNPRRADIAEDAMYNFIDGLIGYQNRGIDIAMAEVGFGTGSNTRSNWTTTLTTIRGHFDEGVEGGSSSSNYHGSNHGNYGYNGTNWSSAFDRANSLLNNLGSRSDYPTFVILVTDGGPTAGGSGGTTVPGPNVPWTSYRNHYLAAVQDARSIQTRDNTTLYGIYALGTDANLLDDLMYYANTGEHRTVNGYSIRNATQNQHNFGLDEGAENYYGAANASALNDAISEIFNQIVEAMGITEVSMKDGTTNEVTASSGEVVASLLGVDEESYQYWMSIPVDSNNQFKRTKNVNGVAEEITYTVNGGTVTWTEGGASKSVALDGSVKNGQFKFEWTKDDFPNDFYEYAPNEAELVNGAVEWDLSNVGVLLDGVTYSVTFDVYPSQTALDYKARLDNGEAYNDVVPEEARDYFYADGTLETNTEGSVTYSDTRDNTGPTTTPFENPPAVPTKASSMTVKKEWEGANPPSMDLKLDILMDGDEEHPFYEATLNSAGDWEATFNISAGMIVDGEPLPDAMGHDFTFAELGDEQYRWELHAPTVRPMIIDGADQPTILIKEDVENGYDSSGKTTYTIDGGTYYVDPAISTLTATNHRRSNLNLTKVVTGEGADPDALFPFTLTVNNIKAPNEEPTDDPDHNSDYWVWFSIKDAENTTVTDATVSGATAASGGYYYAESGSPITVQMKAGWNLRFTNLPSGSTYTFEEGSASGFEFVSAENTGSADETFDVDGKTATGTIVTYNAQAYEVTFTNEYKLRDATIVKTFTGITEDQIPDGFKVTASYDNTTKDFTVDDDDVEVSADGLTYTWKITGLTIGTEVSVTESGAAITNYDLEATLPEEPLTVAEDGENTIEIENEYTLAVGNLKITKVLGNGSEQVTIPADTTFTISGPVEKTVKYSAFQNGSYTFEDLPIGKYTVTESGADITGYTLTTTVSPEKADVASGATAEVTVTNTYTKKTDTDRIDNYITVEKVDGDGTALEGATFSLTGNDVNKTFQAGTAVITTGALEQGQTGVALNLPDLNAGETTTLTLTMEETEAPSGYQKDDATYTITIQGKGEEALTNGVFVTTTTYTISTTLQGKVVNTKITGTDRTDGTVTIKKVDQDGEALDGATFSLTGGNINLTFTAGTAVISTGTLNDGAAGVSLKDYLPDLKDGETKTLTLTLKETAAPGGYTPDTDEYEVVITGAGEETLTDGVFVTTTIYTIKVDGEEELEVTNTKKTDTDREDGTVTIKKVDQDGKALDGATFSLTGTGVSETITIGEATIGTGTEGTVKLNLPDLEAGKTSSLELTLKEETAPAGYTEDDTEYKVVITGEAKEELVNDTWVTTTTYTIKVDGKTELEVTNTKNTDTDREDGTVTIKKVDQDGKALDGAVFSLTGSGINETITIGETEIGTGSDGTLALNLPDLAAGETKKYELTLKETKAPDGYELDNTAHSVVIIGEAKEESADNTWVTLTTYTITVDGSDELVITNKVKQDPPPIPETGDSFIRRNLPWMIIMMVALIGATGVVVYRIKSRKNG